MSSSIKSRLLPALLAALNGIALAQLPEFKIDIPDGTSQSGYIQFGYSVAIDGDYAVVGSYREEIDGQDHKGAAYVYKRNGSSWELEQKLTVPNSDLTQYNILGVSVDIDGNSIVLGATNNTSGGGSANNLEGAAFVFVRDGTTWSQQGRLVQTNPQMTSGSYNNGFGRDVAISGDYVIIGAYWDNGNGTLSNNKYRMGAAFIFVRSGTTWSEQQEIFANDNASSDYFGTSVAIDGDYAIVGSPYDDDGGGASGSAYIFKRTGTTWSQEDKIRGSTTGYSDRFGTSLAINGDYTVAGNSYQGGGGSSTAPIPAVYVFKRDNAEWNQQAILNPEAKNGFGTEIGSVDIDGDMMVVGADAGIDNEFGSIYSYKRNGTDWNLSAKAIASDASTGLKLGNSVSISGDYIIAGTWEKGAYVFTNTTPTIISVALAADNSTIAVTLSEAVYSTSGGSGDLDASDFVLSISGGWATLTSATPTSISASGNVYTLGIGLSGIANGSEYLTVKPAENAIYNAAGNPALTNQLLNTVNLDQKTLVHMASETSYAGQSNSWVKIDDNTYALAYTGGGADGYIVTFTIPPDGSSITKVDVLEYDTGQGQYNSLMRVDDDTYALAYTGPQNDGFIKTFTIPADGSSITEEFSLEHNTDYNTYNRLLKFDEDTYLLVFVGNGTHIKTFTIPADGASITKVDSTQINNYTGNAVLRSLIKIDHNTVLYSGSGTATYSISSDGSIIEKVPMVGGAINNGYHSSVLHVEGDIYAVAVRDKIVTYNIPADGSAFTQVTEFDYEENTVQTVPQFLKLNSQHYVVSYQIHSPSKDYHLKLIEISADGQTITSAGNLTHETNQSSWADIALVRVDANTFALATSKASNYVAIKTFTANFIDDRAPTMSVIGLSQDNSTVDIRFSEEVYNTSGESGDLEASDFSFSISGGTASLTSSIPTSINNIDAVTWRLGLNISGGSTSTGEEILTVSPVSSSIYDAAGNAASSSTDGYLSDNLPPTITDVTIRNDGNQTVDVTFSDKMYDTVLEAGDIEETDFVFSISGGTASLNSTTPTSISGSGKTWALGVDVSGTSDGYEVLTLNPAENAIFDRGGNAASATQSNNTTNLKADKVGTSNAVLIEANYTYYHSLVQMNVLNYAVAYGGAQGHGHIKTFATSADGICRFSPL